MAKYWRMDEKDFLQTVLAKLEEAQHPAPKEKCEQLAELWELLEPYRSQMTLPEANELTQKATTFGQEYPDFLEEKVADIYAHANSIKEVLSTCAEESLLAAQRFFECAIDLLLGRPSCRLACYGSLRPGEKNYHIVGNIPGSWDTGTIRGFVWKWNGYPVYVRDDEGPEIVVSVLESPQLTQEYPRLDEFEGADYRRVLVPVRFSGSLVLCNIYESNVQQ